MRLHRATPARLAAAALVAGIVLPLALSAAEDEPEKKSGFFSKITGIFKKSDKAETPPEPAREQPVEKSQPSSSSGSAKKSGAKSEGKSSGTPASKSKSSGSGAKAKESPKTTGKSGSEPKAGTVKMEEPKPEPAKTLVAEKKSEAPKDPPKPADTGKKPEQTRVSAPPAAGATSAFASARTADMKRADSSPKLDEDGRPLDVTRSSASSSVSNLESRTLTEHPSALSPLPPTKDGTWEVVKIAGRDYVTGDSIHRFYRFSTYKVEGKHVWFRSTNLIMKAGLGSQELLINNIKFVLSFPVESSGGKAVFSRLDLCKLIDPVLRPSYITGAEPFDTVVLDAGHGGHDSGAKGVYGYEKDFTLKMAYAVKSALEKRGFKVIMTRTTDVFISRTGRVAIANKTPNCIFVSLHFNSGGSSATGIETFALTPQFASASLERGGGYNSAGLTGNQQDSENIALATALHALVIHRFKLVDRGIKRAQWTVLTGCQKPGILFEGGFITNAKECQLVASQTYREALANTIGDAVMNYRRALKPNVVGPGSRR